LLWSPHNLIDNAFDIESNNGFVSQVFSTDVNPVDGQSIHSVQAVQVTQMVGVQTGVKVSQVGVGSGVGVGVGVGSIIVPQVCVKHSHPQVSQGCSLQSHPQVNVFSLLPLQISHP
jgi:hypothetical protein